MFSFEASMIHFRFVALRFPIASDGGSYSSRRAVATGVLAARIAGSRPPTIPIASAKKTPLTSNSGVILKANARLENVCQLMVAVVRPFSGRTATQPTTPPINDIRKASNKNDVTTAIALKPMAGSRAISPSGHACAHRRISSSASNRVARVTA